MTAGLREATEPTAGGDPFPISGFAYVEFWVGNAYASAQFLRALLGFRIRGYRGPETGVPTTASYLLSAGEIRFVVTGALGPDHPVAQHVLQHGPAVHDVAFAVPDVRAAWERALERGAESAYAPVPVETERGRAVRAGIRTYGETIHSLVESEGELFPDFQPRRDTVARSTGLTGIDHVVGNVARGQMEVWVEFYERVFGFTTLRHFDDRAISTEYSALMSKVLWDGRGTIRLPINEPAQGRRRSQIDEYLLFQGGPGVQHVALATDNLVATVGSLRRRGLDLMEVPAAYYDELRRRMPDLGAEIDTLADLQILADEDTGGQLLQIFSHMMQDRPTFFFEFIERRGAVGFGEGNFKALFEAIECAQAARGNL